MNTNKSLLSLSVLIIMLFFRSQGLQGQVFKHWEFRYNGTGNSYDQPLSIVVDEKSNAYLTGESNGLNSGSDFFTAKVDSAGVMNWGVRYSSISTASEIAYCIAQDSYGNLYVSGTIWGLNSWDCAIIKYDNYGNQIWQRSYDGQHDDYPVSLVVDNLGNPIITCKSYNTITKLDFSIVKYDTSGQILYSTRLNTCTACDNYPAVSKIDTSGNLFAGGTTEEIEDGNSDFLLYKLTISGNVEWSRTYGSGSDKSDGIVDMAIDQYGNIVVTGYAGGGFDSDILTIKYDTYGNMIWNDTFQGPGLSDDESNAMEIDRYNNVIITGRTFNGMGKYEVVTIKYSPSGQKTWVKIFNEGFERLYNAAYSIDSDTSGNVIIAGNIDRTLTGDDIFTLKYGSDGNLLWTAFYNGIGNSTDYPSRVIVDKSNDIIVMGYSFGLSNNYDYVLLKYSENEYPMLSLDASVLLEGRYDSVSNQLADDSVMIVLHEQENPYNGIDTARVRVNSTGHAMCEFRKSQLTRNYFVEVKHRSSIAVWSSSPKFLVTGQTNVLQLKDDRSLAYGMNIKEVDKFPIQFALYSGDVNQDGIIDAGDCAITDNDAFNFTTGYSVTDLNGDLVVDAEDLVIVTENAYSFVVTLQP
ncbi:MAG: SBBP repeat-containing protein [Ignavibacteria bacterium]|nr:SBBP repeat-containing protein [Ignavibacteria bacterium]